MTRLRTTPSRGRYRVYTEEEFFACERLLAAAESSAPSRRALPVVAPVGIPWRSPAARLAGLASLSVAVAAVAGVVALEARSRHGGGGAAGRRTALGPRVAGAGSGRAAGWRTALEARVAGAGSPAAGLARRAAAGRRTVPVTLVHTHRPALASPAHQPAVHAQRAGGHSPLAASAAGATTRGTVPGEVAGGGAATAEAGTGTTPTPAAGGVATATAAAPGAVTPTTAAPSAGTPTATAPSTATPTTAAAGAATPTATTASVGGARPEFGFER